MAVYPQVVLPDASFLQAESYSAQADRQPMEETGGIPGCRNRSEHNVSVVSGRTARLAPGVSYVRGRNVANQGFYRVLTTANADVTLNAGDATNPRIDQIILRVMDNAHDSSGFNETRLEAVPGTPTAGATLDNRNGALNLDSLGEASKNTLLLYDVEMAAGATIIAVGTMRDRRVFCAPTIPNIKADTLIDVCPFQFIAPLRDECAIAHASNDLDQSAALVWLPRPITTDGIKWNFQHAATAIAGNYKWALFDASGRLLLETATTAFSGAADGNQQPLNGWTAGDTFIDAGMYWLFFAIDTTAGTMHTYGVNPTPAGTAASPPPGGSFVTIIGSDTGGMTVPTNFAGIAFSDIWNTSRMPVPYATLVRST